MIRPAEEKDIQRIAEIYEKIHGMEEQGKMHVGWSRGVYPVRQTAIAAVERREMFVEETDGHIVAAGILNQQQLPEYASCDWKYPAEDSEVMVLHTLVVDPEESGHGYAKAFVQFYEAYAVEKNCRCLRIDTQEKNLAARSLYSKLGFTEPGLVTCIFNGIPDVKLVCLEKKLA